MLGYRAASTSTSHKPRAHVICKWLNLFSSLASHHNRHRSAVNARMHVDWPRVAKLVDSARSRMAAIFEFQFPRKRNVFFPLLRVLPACVCVCVAGARAMKTNPRLLPDLNYHYRLTCARARVDHRHCGIARAAYLLRASSICIRASDMRTL